MLDALSTLMGYPLSDVIFIILCSVVLLRFIWSLVDWFGDKLKKEFNIRTEKEKREQEFKEAVLNTTKKIEEQELQFTDAILTIKAMIDELKNKVCELEDKENLTQERIQQDSRAYLIDKHKRFMSAGWIDIHSLENLEIRYMYYKAAGGNTFVNGLMDDLRALPKTLPEEGEED